MAKCNKLGSWALKGYEVGMPISRLTSSCWFSSGTDNEGHHWLSRTHVSNDDVGGNLAWLRSCHTVPGGCRVAWNVQTGIVIIGGCEVGRQRGTRAVDIVG